MKIFRFRDWQVYKDARNFRKDLIKDIAPQIKQTKSFALQDQLERALVSIVLNIAEGAYRKTKKDFAKFLNQAITSVNEVVACLDLCLDDDIIDNKLHNKYLKRADFLIKQLNSFVKSLLKDSN